MRSRYLAALSVIGGPVAAYTLFARRWQLRWGATDKESEEQLPGDDLIPNADLAATRAITIRASADQVWPWIAQLGQGRGGFYSYDFLENLVGCDIHSADRIVPEWQDLEVGDEVRFAPEVGLAVASVEQGRSLVLRGGVPIGNTAPPYDFTWAFVLRDEPDKTTRILVRERYAYTRPWARLIVEPTEVLSFVMSQKMLRGIKVRAERHAVRTRWELRPGETSAVGGDLRGKLMKVAPLGPRPVAQHLESIVRRHPVSDADRSGRLFHDPVVLNDCF
jgi:hypothetical protein